MSYRLSRSTARVLHGLGDNVPYTGPANDDPRLVRQYGTVKARYTPRNVTAALAPSVPGMLAANARTKFPHDNVTGAGWFAGGVVGYNVIVATETRLGDLRRQINSVGLEVGPRIGPGTELVNARVQWDWNDIKAAPGMPAPAETETTVATGPGEAAAHDGFFSKKLGGVPVWALGLVGIVIVGGGGFALLRKKRAPAAVTANRRRRVKRRVRANAKKTYIVYVYDASGREVRTTNGLPRIITAASTNEAEKKAQKLYPGRQVTVEYTEI